MSDLQDLRNNFEKLKSIRLNIKKIFDSLETLKQKLKGIYLDYIEQNKKNDYTFGLDALHFQNMLIDLEYDNMDKLYKIIDNKMYCEYYKLFKLICKYVEENTAEKKILDVCKTKTQFPIYKDLEQFKVYEFNLINELHHNILQLLDEMIIIYKNKQHELETDQMKSRYGLNLDNYIFTLSYKNETIFQNVKLFTRYLQSYHKYHTLYLTRLDIKLRLMWGQMNEDIKINSIHLNNSNEPIVQSEPKLKKVPSISFKQQSEILNYIMTDNTNQEVKKEFESIISNISDSNDDGSIEDIVECDRQSTPKNDDISLVEREEEAENIETLVKSEIVEDKPVEEKPAEEKVVEEKPVEEKVVEEKPAEEKVVEEKPTEDNITEPDVQEKKEETVNNTNDILKNVDHDKGPQQSTPVNNIRPHTISAPLFVSTVQRAGMVASLKKQYNR